MIQRSPANQQSPSEPATRPAWMTFCLDLLPLAITQHDLAAQQTASPKKIDAPAGEVMTHATIQQRARCAHKLWARSDGFTLSGSRRV